VTLHVLHSSAQLRASHTEQLIPQKLTCIDFPFMHLNVLCVLQVFTCRMPRH